MKTTKWLGLMAVLVGPLLTAQAQTPAGPTPPSGAGTVPAVSPTAADVVRLAEAGTSDDVMLAYIQNSTTTFDLSADQILYLRDIGLSSPVITAMLTRDNALRNQPQPNTYPGTAPVSAPLVPTPEPAPPPAVVEAPPPVYVASPPVEVSYFYDQLSPYGSWVQLEGVGWCWQPRVVVINRGWQPYCDSGHWVFTDAGWCWQSDYSWGWAPFHYGRWQLHERCGWVWLPDRVWGPAWVTWRYEGDHCGWAPLPPRADFDLHLGYRFNGISVGLNFDFGLRPEHFTFIALHDFGERDFSHHRLPPTEVTRIYNNTTIINNYVVNNTTIVNQGIKVDRVAAATHTEFRKVAIRDVPAGFTAASSSRASDKAGMVVYRPQLKAPPKKENIVAQRVDERHPVIQHAPIAPTTTQRPAVAGTAPRSPANGKPAAQVQSPGPSVRPGATKSPSYQEVRPSARPAQPALSTPSTASAPSANRPVEQQLKPAPAPAATYHSEQGPAQPVHPSIPATQAPATRQYPPQVATANSPNVPRAYSQGQNPQIYYPKGYHQAQGNQPMVSRGTADRPQPQFKGHPSEAGQPSMNPRQSGGPDSGNKGQGGPGHKNDQ